MIKENHIVIRLSADITNIHEKAARIVKEIEENNR